MSLWVQTEILCTTLCWRQKLSTSIIHFYIAYFKTRGWSTYTGLLVLGEIMKCWTEGEPDWVKTKSWCWNQTIWGYLDQYHGCWCPGSLHGLATVPLTTFQSNLKFDQNLQCSGLKCTLPITTKFCTRHDIVTVVKCAKFCFDQLIICQTTALQIFIKFQIRSKYH